MIWGFMIQLGHNMWGERPLFGEAPKAGREHMFAHDFNRTGGEGQLVAGADEG